MFASFMSVVFLPFLFLFILSVGVSEGKYPIVALHCSSPPHETSMGRHIDCYVDSDDDPDSRVQWWMVTPDGRRLNLGHCERTYRYMDACQSPLEPRVVVVGGYFAWNSITFSNFQEWIGSTLICSATSFGREKRDECLLKTKSSAPASRYHCDSTNGRPTAMTEKEFQSQCCNVEHEGYGFSVSRFSCENGCCGDKDSQYCCTTDQELGLIIGLSVFGFVAFVALVIFLVWVFRKACRGVKQYSDHKRMLREVYSARRVDELFAPAQPLASAPGTIVHPLTNVNGHSSPEEEQQYTMGHVPSHPQILPEALTFPRYEGDGNDRDLDEEIWNVLDSAYRSSDGGGQGTR